MRSIAISEAYRLDRRGIEPLSPCSLRSWLPTLKGDSRFRLEYYPFISSYTLKDDTCQLLTKHNMLRGYCSDILHIVYSCPFFHFLFSITREPAPFRTSIDSLLPIPQSELNCIGTL